MKKWMVLGLALTMLFSACAHDNCCAKCKREKAAAAAEGTSAAT